ncbi:hypothetical protein BY458DRAFT_505396 [Sporodiniella umbellata]|nr:hypothetical protein BY458DRAFT_505396 [Sporodiniella umbellata]
MYKENICQCLVSKWAEKEPLDLKITYAEKTQTENQSFIVYTIQTQDKREVKRRYSEFEHLRKVLLRLYPVLLVPPIPEKHSIVEYTRKDESAEFINKRKRMLERFLMRVGIHPILRQEHVFHRFIHGKESWNEISLSPPVSDLPKESILTQPLTMQIHTSSSYTLKTPNLEFEQAETQVSKSIQEKGTKLDKSQKTILKRLSDLSNDYNELGSVYNALSLYEPSNILSGFIEKLGQVIDDSCSSANEMIRELEIECAEHIQDYTHYIHIAHQALKYRHKKQAELEWIHDTLGQRHLSLSSLVRRQDESDKLKTDMDSLSLTHDTQQVTDEGEDDFLDTESIEDGFAAIIKDDFKKQEDEYNYPENATLSTVKSSKEKTKKWSSTKKLLSAFSFTIQGMIDSDPEQTRQNQISKTRESILQLENTKQSTNQELIDISSTLKEELKRLEEQQSKELKHILISFAKIHLTYCERVRDNYVNV